MILFGKCYWMYWCRQMFQCWNMEWKIVTTNFSSNNIIVIITCWILVWNDIWSFRLFWYSRNVLSCMCLNKCFHKQWMNYIFIKVYCIFVVHLISEDFLSAKFGMTIFHLFGTLVFSLLWKWLCIWTYSVWLSNSETSEVFNESG